MRSTPWPNDTLRTVNDARVPPRCMPITTPSKIWMRSLSPSRTFTWTRTVSPDFIAGRSVNCVFSTSSMALMFLLLQLPQNSPFFIVERRCIQQVGPQRQCARDRFPFAPAPNRGVVSRQQHLGYPPPLRRDAPGAVRRVAGRRVDLGRTRVLGKVQQPPVERIVHHRLLIPHHSWNEPGDRIDNHQRRHFSAAQHVIPDRDLFIDPQFYALVHPFVSAAD